MSARRTAAIALLDRFAADTGLTSSRPPRRYLWTDAFAVSTWVGLEEGRCLDLALRLVPSMGMHDLLDGLVSCATLGLDLETRELARMCEGRSWATDDPLGAGGLLVDALHLARLVASGREELRALLTRVLQDAQASAEAVVRSPLLRFPAQRRLAFRE